VIKTIEATPVQDQFQTGTCWSFSALAFLESELIRTGKGQQNLSEMYVVNHTYKDKAERYARMQGHTNFGAGGAFADAAHVWKKYGMVPEEVYTGLNYGSNEHNHSELDALLKAYVDGIVPSWLTAKGFVVGGGGEDEFGNVAFARKDFKPLILWLPSVRTNQAGEATFTTEAPDNLTRFRFIAVGQTRDNQFGAGDATIEVSKALSIEPALPRFLRVGDEVELRAVVRQRVEESADVNVRVLVSGNLVLEGEPTQKSQPPKMRQRW